MPENELRPFGYFAVHDVKPAVQVIQMTRDPALVGGVFRRAAAAHIIADLVRMKEPYQILDEFWRTIPAVSV